MVYAGTRLQRLDYRHWLATGARRWSCFFDGVAAELVTEGGDDAHGEGVVIARGEAGVEGVGDYRGGDAAVDSLEDGPAALAGVVDIALDLLEVRVPAKGVLRELEEPGANDAAGVPEGGDGLEVVVVVRALKEVETRASRASALARGFFLVPSPFLRGRVRVRVGPRPQTKRMVRS